MLYQAPGLLFVILAAIGTTIVVMKIVPWCCLRQVDGAKPKESDPNILVSQSLLDLWKYFENRGASVKNTMLSIVTWATALVAAVFGFAVKYSLYANAADESAPDPTLCFLSSVVGIGLVLYVDLLIWDFGGHIQQNFDRADLAREGDRGFDEILGLNPSAKKLVLPKICKRLRLAFWGFCFGFAYLAVTSLGCLLKLMVENPPKS